MHIANSITELIGNTPIIQINTPEKMANIFIKLEYFNPGGSIKDRIALQMIEDAENEGHLKKGDTIIEATSGNTGIGLAMVAAAKGYSAIFVMPETMSIERRNLLKAYGAELVLTPGKLGMKGAVIKAEEIAIAKGYLLMRQFENKSNPKAHRLHTAQEIINQMGGKIDAFIVGIGTGGTITGIGEILRKLNPAIGIYGVEPKDSAVLSGKEPGPHMLQGIGAGFIPSILNTEIYNGIIQVTTEEAFEAAKKAAKEQGILGGISTGANLFAALKVAKELGQGKNIVTIAASNGERYLSTPLYDFE